MEKRAFPNLGAGLRVPSFPGAEKVVDALGGASLPDWGRDINHSPGATRVEVSCDTYRDAVDFFPKKAAIPSNGEITDIQALPDLRLQCVLFHFHGVVPRSCCKADGAGFSVGKGF